MYSLNIYTNQQGDVIPASQTDQAGSCSKSARTANGQPLAFVGEYYPSQLAYRPFRQALANASKLV